MKKLPFMILVLLGIFGVAQRGWATQAYVTDSFEVTLRTGPSNENKITAMLFSGRSLDILSTQGEWSHVRVSDSDKEGWVLSRYLVTRLPWEVQAKKLQEEMAAMTARLTRLDKESADGSLQRQTLASELKRKTDALGQLSKEHEELKKGAEGYLKLKTLYEASERDLTTARAEINRLSAENEALRSSQQNRWFLSGALVLLCGLLIGGIAGRQQKKKRSLYS